MCSTSIHRLTLSWQHSSATQKPTTGAAKSFGTSLEYIPSTSRTAARNVKIICNFLGIILCVMISKSESWQSDQRDRKRTIMSMGGLPFSAMKWAQKLVVSLQRASMNEKAPQKNSKRSSANLRAGLLADDCCWARLFWAASRHLGPAVIGPRLRSTRPILLSPGPYVDEQEIYVSSLSTNKRINVFFLTRLYIRSTHGLWMRKHQTSSSSSEKL